jgi:CBS domain-containing protein
MINATAGPQSRLTDLRCQAVTTAAENSTLGEVALAMRRANVSAVVLAGSHGVVTERDLTRGLAARLGPDDPVAGVATEIPIVVGEEMTVLEAAELMLAQHVRHVIVRSPGRDIVAVISIRDIVGVLLQSVDPMLPLFLRRMVSEHAEIWLG